MNEANEKAKRIIDDANKEVASIRKEYDNIRKEAIMFKAKFKSLLVSQIEATDSYYNISETQPQESQLK